MFSLTDHGQNGLYHWWEWIPVVNSDLSVGFLSAIYVTPITRGYLRLCALVLLLQAAVGVLGFVVHSLANSHRPSPDIFDNSVFGAPALASMLRPNLTLLCGVGLWELARHLPASEQVIAGSNVQSADGR